MPTVADRLESELIGRNVLAGRWTFQIVEEYDDTYWSLFRELEKQARDELADGRRHLYEARLKQDERTAGAPESTPREATPAIRRRLSRPREVDAIVAEPRRADGRSDRRPACRGRSVGPVEQSLLTGRRRGGPASGDQVGDLHPRVVARVDPTSSRCAR